ncbi:DUF3613 domain-containing protein [Aquipseudomonas campi]
MNARWTVALIVMLPLSIQAAEMPATNAKSTVAGWLEQQRSGAQASPHEQRATPAERELSYQRWLDSYRHAIPEFFDTSGSPGSSSGK